MIFEDMTCQKSEEDIEAIVSHYLPKIKYYASKLSFNLPSGLSEEDLVSAGVAGLLESMKRYDSKREASLKTFSDCRIKGAIIDEIRAMLWTSRDARKKISNLRTACQSLADKFSRPPTDCEITDELGISFKKLNKIYFASHMNNIQSLNETITGNEGETKEIIDYLSTDDNNPFEVLEIKQSRMRLESEIRKLPFREKLIILLYYYEELRLKDISKIMRVTESRICQILNNALSRLKENISDTALLT
ncbi:MAG: FliA/WhiG family RNA polymerase sigma factor [Nitrospiraceae bacterium]|nr:FliA/WhiG family RNA polymerase sigma factor [Nitrospiraceae bacterium]